MSRAETQYAVLRLEVDNHRIHAAVRIVNDPASGGKKVWLPLLLLLLLLLGNTITACRRGIHWEATECHDTKLR
jgi:hypothetical protein